MTTINQSNYYESDELFFILRESEPRVDELLKLGIDENEIEILGHPDQLFELNEMTHKIWFKGKEYHWTVIAECKYATWFWHSLHKIREREASHKQ
jgi:hypothetical protein